MDIYKITDDVPKRASRQREIRELEITNLKQGVKNPNRVNVFVDDKFSFSLDISQVVELGVKVGLIVTPEKIAEYRQASEYGKMYQRALEWVLMRPRSERELRDYLWRKKRRAETELVLGSRPSGPSPRADGANSRAAALRNPPKLAQSSAYIDTIIRQLVSRGYVDDRRFAEFWVENRFVKKGVSQKRLMVELQKKGIARDIIEEVIDGRDETEEICKMIARKKGKYTEEKLMQYLCRQGFKYDKVKEVLDDYLSSSTSEGA